MKSGNTTRKVAVLVVSTVSSFLTPFMGSAINVALPSIGADFAIDAVTLGWIATVYLLAAAIFVVPFGRIADIYGRKKILVFGLTICTIASLASALSPSAILLIIFRAFQGVGGAMILGTAIAILTSVYPVKERGAALGVNVAATYIGLSLGPVLAGFLTEHLGWRTIFIPIVVIGVIAIAVALRNLKGDWAEAKGERFDLTGSLVYGIALAGLMYGLTILPSGMGVALLVGGFAGLLLFVLWEMKTTSPVLNIGLFKDNTVFSLSIVAALINYSATFAVSFLMSLYLQYMKGLDPASAGLVLVSQPIVMAVLSPFTGRLSDRIEPRVVASAGMTLTMAGLIMLEFVNKDTGFEFIVSSLVLLGLGFGFFSSPNTNAAMGAVDKKYYGVASGTLATMRNIGMMLSLGIATLLFSLYIGRVQITPEYYPMFMDSFRMAFIIFAVLCFGGIFASLARGNTR